MDAPRSPDRAATPGVQAQPEGGWDALCAQARIYLAAGAWQSTHELLWPRFAHLRDGLEIPREALQCLCLLMAAWFRLKRADDLARGRAWLQAAAPGFAELDDETRALGEHALALLDVRDGHHSIARGRLARLAPATLERVTPWVRARIALLQGRIAAEAGGQADAERHGLDAARAAGLAGSETLRGDAFALLAIVARRRGALTEANKLNAQAATHYWQAGNISGHTGVLLNRAWALGLIGLLTESRRLFQEVLSQASAGMRPTTALRAKLGLGWLAVRGGDPEAARRRLLSVWREARRLRLPREQGLALEYLAETHTLAGALGKAETALRLAERQAAQVGPDGDLALEAGVRRATLLLARGDLAAAIACAQEVIARAERMAMPWESAQALRIIGISAFRTGRSEEALAAFMRAREILTQMGELLERRAVAAWVDALEHLRGGVGLRADVAAHRPHRDTGASADGTRARAQLFWLRHPLLGPAHWLHGDEADASADDGPSDGRVPENREPKPAFAREALESSVTRADLNPVWAELGLVTRTPDLVQTLQLAETYAPGRIPVLILGETGTGKDLLAQGLSRLAGRTGGFVPVNCASAQRDLFVAELFGARRGAYTGAVERRRGLIEEAEGGTIFFDEIADLAPEAQGYLLRFLDSGEVRPLGETRSRRIETRVVAATCRDLRAMVRQGRFRPDLHARLAGLVLRLPPLRERPEDFDLLVEMLWQREGGSAIECRAVFTPGLQADLQQLAWPGNVRELRHAVSRALLYSRTHGARATLANPRQWLRGIGGLAPEGDHVPAAQRSQEAGLPSHATRAPHAPAGDWSRATLEAALAAGGGRIAEAARKLGVSRSHAYRLYRQLRDTPHDSEDGQKERTG